MLKYVPLRGMYYHGTLEAFREEHEEWSNSEDLRVRYVKAERDYIYELAASAISAVITWLTMSAANGMTSAADGMTAEGTKLWVDLMRWRVRQPNPPLEPRPRAPMHTTVPLVLPGQLSLFSNPT